MWSQPGGFMQSRVLRPSWGRKGQPNRPWDCSHCYNSCIVCPAHGHSDETTTDWRKMKHSIFPQYLSFCLLSFFLSSLLPIIAYVHNEHTINTCRLTKPCNRMKSMHTQVFLGRWPGNYTAWQTECFTNLKDLLFLLLPRKTCSVPQMALQLWSPLSLLLSPKYQPIFQDLSQVPPPRRWPPCPALFCRFTPGPFVLPHAQNVCFQDTGHILRNLFTYLFCLPLLDWKFFEAKNFVLLISIFSHVVFGTR